jgi:hypothetical protein
MADRRTREPKAEPGTHLTPLQRFRTFAIGILSAVCVCSAPLAFCGDLAVGKALAVPPSWSVNQPIYEINLQTFSQAGTYKELEKHLPVLRDQGIGILWLMPIATRGLEKAFGSPYCVKDYRGFHAPHGTENDFRDLVAAVHAHGLRISNYDWDLMAIQDRPVLAEISQGAKPATVIDGLLAKEKDYRPGFMRMRFTSNHDEWNNLSGADQDVSISGDVLAGTYRELFTGEGSTQTAQWRMRLPPWGYRVMVAGTGTGIGPDPSAERAGTIRGPLVEGILPREGRRVPAALRWENGTLRASDFTGRKLPPPPDPVP